MNGLTGIAHQLSRYKDSVIQDVIDHELSLSLKLRTYNQTGPVHEVASQLDHQIREELDVGIYMSTEKELMQRRVRAMRRSDGEGLLEVWIS